MVQIEDVMHKLLVIYETFITLVTIWIVWLLTFPSWPVFYDGSWRGSKTPVGAPPTSRPPAPIRTNRVIRRGDRKLPRAIRIASPCKRLYK